MGRFFVGAFDFAGFWRVFVEVQADVYPLSAYK